MSASLDLARPGRGLFSPRSLLLGLPLGLAALAILFPISPFQAAWIAFLLTAALTAKLLNRGSLDSVRVERRHRPRVFENDAVSVTLSVRQEKGPALNLLMVEDQFLASLNVHQRRLIPMLTPAWEARLHYAKEAERHRGLYMLGPARLVASDPLGIFYKEKEEACVTKLLVYPRAEPLPGYRFPGPRPPMGPAMASDARVGQGEEILSVRPFQNGDPLTRVHWKTSARRGALHTIELDTTVQVETALLLDLTRRARFGTGAEATTETIIGCATSILSQASAERHRLSLALVRDSVELIPAGAGIGHLHLLLDRLAAVNYAGDLEFWSAIEPAAALLKPGSRAVFIAPAATTPGEAAAALVRRLALGGVGADIILIDDSELIRVFRNQDPPHRLARERYARLEQELGLAGARVFAIRKGETAADLLKRAPDENARGRSGSARAAGAA